MLPPLVGRDPLPDDVPMETRRRGAGDAAGNAAANRANNKALDILWLLEEHAGDLPAIGVKE